MSDINSLWVLGHKVRLMDTDDSYALAEITSPPGVPGPPPHFHKHEREFFLILKGALDVMTNGKWETMVTGNFVEMPPNTVHTFINNTGEDVVWITGWRPKGFEEFFREFGIPAGEKSAKEQSVSKEVIQRVVKGCEQHGMFVSQ